MAKDKIIIKSVKTVPIIHLKRDLKKPFSLEKFRLALKQFTTDKTKTHVNKGNKICIKILEIIDDKNIIVGEKLATLDAPPTAVISVKRMGKIAFIWRPSVVIVLVVFEIIADAIVKIISAITPTHTIRTTSLMPDCLCESKLL